MVKPNVSKVKKPPLHFAHFLNISPLINGSLLIRKEFTFKKLLTGQQIYMPEKEGLILILINL